MKIGIIKESRTPAERRVALLPQHCQAIQAQYPEIHFVVQPYRERCVHDQAYIQAGCTLQNDLSECDIILGIKEVLPQELIPHKTYFFFSHTIKKQAHNRLLLQTALLRQIRLIDYECITNELGERLVAFGRFAGLVGAYNGLRAFAWRYQHCSLKPAHECQNLEEIAQILQNISLPPIKIAITGRGRVGKGAVEVMQMAGIKEVSPDNFVTQTYNRAVFTVLASTDYYRLKEGVLLSEQHFHQYPQHYGACFEPYAQVADMLITTHFWNPQADKLFSAEDMQKPTFRLKIIADISCDINGSVPCTLQTSTIAEPFYDYNPKTKQVEKAFSHRDNITIMAIDNLPSELPFDASLYFGNQFVKHIIPALLGNDTHRILANATITQAGELTPKFAYLSDFASPQALPLL